MNEQTGTNEQTNAQCSVVLSAAAASAPHSPLALVPLAARCATGEWCLLSGGGGSGSGGGGGRELVPSSMAARAYVSLTVGFGGARNDAVVREMMVRSLVVVL